MADRVIPATTIMEPRNANGNPGEQILVQTFSDGTSQVVYTFREVADATLLTVPAVATAVLRVRYNDAGTMRVGDLALV